VRITDYVYDFIYIGINENGVVVYLFNGSKPGGADLVIGGYTRFSYGYIEVDYSL